MNAKNLDDVRQFWEANPLFTGESPFQPGSREYYEDHRETVFQDCFAGQEDPRLVPPPENRDGVLDLGCGPGLWTVELDRWGCENITSADLTEQALVLARKRCELFDVTAVLQQENAESLSFKDHTFSHVNCQGVIHHTPDTKACVREIARVLKPGGSALISVYYRNLLLRNWRYFSWMGGLLYKMGSKMKGRGRETMFTIRETDELVRAFDGSENPIGKAYNKKTFRKLLEPELEIEEIFFHFFPARALPVPFPKFLHRFLDRNLGFMIYAKARKRQEV